jgi:hypothetical protein
MLALANKLSGPFCQRSLGLFLLRAWLRMPLRDSQLSEADEDLGGSHCLGTCADGRTPTCVKGLIIMGTLRAVKQRQMNAHMFIYQSKK